MYQVIYSLDDSHGLDVLLPGHLASSGGSQYLTPGAFATWWGLLPPLWILIAFQDVVYIQRSTALTGNARRQKFGARFCRHHSLQARR